MTGAPFRVLFLDRAFLTIYDIDRLTQASVLFADETLLRTSIALDSSLTDDESAFAARRLAFLHEIGAVRYWSIEGEYNATPSGAASDVVIPYEAYQELYEQVTERAQETRDLFLSRGAGEQIDGVTEVVLGRNQLWKFALASELRADRLLLDDSSHATMNKYLNSPLVRLQAIEEPVLDVFLKDIHVDNIALLNENALEELRKLMPQFRAGLLAETGTIDSAVATRTIIERVAHKIADEYLDQLEDAARRSSRLSLGRSLVRELYWDLLGYVMPPMVLMKYHELLFSWSRTRSADASLQFVFNLRKIGQGDY